MMSFFDFMQSCRVKKGDRYTHQGMKVFRGIFNIPDKKLAMFWDLYYTHVYELKLPCDLIEKHSEVCFLLYDLDFNLSVDCKDRAYNEQMICKFIQCVTDVCSRYLNENFDCWDCFIFEKEKPSIKNNRLKDGIHIIFPFIVTEPAVQQLIREELLVELEDNNIFKENVNILNSNEDIIDKRVIDKNGWMILGSCKEDGHPYKLTNIYGYDNNEEVGKKFPYKRQNSPYLSIDNNKEKTIELLKQTSIRRKNVAAEIANFKEDMRDIVDQYTDDYNKDREKTAIPLVKKHHCDIIKNGNYTPDLCIVKDLIDILHQKRATSYTTWLEVGWCLYNISPDSLLPSWIKFSERSPEHESIAEADCTKQWNTFQSGEHCKGIGTLKMWAKEDNPEAYFEILQKDKEYLMCQVVKNSSYESGIRGKKRMRKIASSDMIHSIAILLKKCYQNVFICTNFEKKTWYKFTGTRWHVCDGDVELRKKLTGDLRRDFLNLSVKYRKLAMRTYECSPNKEKYELIAQDLLEVYKKLIDTNFKKKIMEEACEHFWREDEVKFEDILDTQTNLVLLNNGVYDLEKQEFREARHDDYLSLSTNNDWKEFKWDDEIIINIMNFITSIMPTEEERIYLLRCFASFLSGDVLGEIFQIWIGDGSNGKSLLCDLLKLTLGEYYDQLDISCLTQKRTSSEKPRPELVKLKGKRVVICAESGFNDELNIGIIKEFTGGDTIPCRQLHKEIIHLKPQFKLVLHCNHLPKVSGEDNGTWRRLRPLPFESIFKNNPDPNKQNEYKSDPQLKKKIKTWGPAFFWILTQYWPDFKKHLYKEPPKVLEKLKEYQQENSQFAEFTLLFIEKGDKKDILYLEQIFSFFQVWYRQTIDDKTPNRKEFQKHLEKNYGKVSVIDNKKVWIGYRSKEEAKPSYALEHL